LTAIATALSKCFLLLDSLQEIRPLSWSIALCVLLSVVYMSLLSVKPREPRDPRELQQAEIAAKQAGSAASQKEQTELPAQPQVRQREVGDNYLIPIWEQDAARFVNESRIKVRQWESENGPSYGYSAPQRTPASWGTSHEAAERDHQRREEIRRVYGREPTPAELSQISQ
jgi:hypothetical protein